MSALPPPPPVPKVRNPRTQAVIQREVLRQITLPLALTLVLTLVVMGLVIAGTATPVQTGALADVSLIFLILINAGPALVILALLAALVYGLAYLLRETPFWLKRVQDFVWAVAMQARSMTRRVDDRIVGVHLSAAALGRIVEHVRALFAPWRTP